ncbi:methyltransferase domain-containing protein [Aurantiacibacter sp. MUD11]|uniref:methyltransferase domain-containing protein n=1 Tax=Aurantiacibacter sp. MUD11 TaxID=3003265 RepID=UPI0022AB3AAC|nr:methyltransferase domain-containing protein [Aurantiacibacter sp. MUD11]WAT18960.1 methyltransferase domain-containing protein [Aurantiacibacter sp. MUD11]
MSEEQIDMAKVEQMAGHVIGHVAGAVSLMMAYLGDQAGVFEAMDGEGPMTLDQLVEKTGMERKYLREWLGSISAAGYVDFDSDNMTWELTPEQALIFAREGQPACMQGFIQSIVAQYEMHEKAVEVFKTGKGRPWSEHSQCMFCGVDRFFRPGYAAHLIPEWLPALKGVTERLEKGAKVADIGCGYGTSTILMAKEYPNSTFVGYDFHEPSIEKARERAAEEGVTNVSFEVARAQDYEGDGFDFACIFDALHDMGDPVGAARHVKESLKPDGTFMIVEPNAGDTMAENMHPMGQIFYGFSCMACVPASLAQEVGLGLGAQAGQKRLTEVLNEAGFSNVRRATETPSNMVLEATV